MEENPTDAHYFSDKSRKAALTGCFAGVLSRGSPHGRKFDLLRTILAVTAEKPAQTGAIAVVPSQGSPHGRKFELLHTILD
jgi:hypothetical protein